MAQERIRLEAEEDHRREVEERRRREEEEEAAIEAAAVAALERERSAGAVENTEVVREVVGEAAVADEENIPPVSISIFLLVFLPVDSYVGSVGIA